MGTLSQKTAKGAVWVLIERFSTQAVDFIVGMVLARLLTPNDYGTVALTGIFFSVARSLVDGGLGMALIQKRDADDLDFNTVFYTGLFSAGVMYAALFFAAPFISRFFRTPELTLIIRVAAISFFFNAVNSVQAAEMSRKMRFDLMFRVSVTICAVASVSGIAFALLGWGPWALVASGILASAVGVLMRWIWIAWRPQLVFSFNRLRSLFAFGWRISASTLVNEAFRKFSDMLIGRYYAKVDLAYVEKGRGLPTRATMAIEETIGLASFPALTQLQDEPERLVSAMRRIVKCSTFLMFPVLAGIAVCADSLVVVLFGNQWLASAIYLKIACFAYALGPVVAINRRGLVACGRVDILLRLDVLTKLFEAVSMLIFLRVSVLAFVSAWAFAVGPLNLLIYMWSNRRFLGYTIRRQFRDLLPMIANCGLMASCVWGIDFLLEAASGGCFGRAMWWLLLKISLEGLIGVLIYLLIAWRYRFDALVEFVTIIAGWARGPLPWLATKLMRIMD